MRRVAFVVLSILVGSAPVAAAQKPKVPSIEEVNGAQPVEPPKKGIGAATLKAQVLLDRLRFSPGVIDGLNGDNYRRALTSFEKSKGLKVDGKIDPEVLGKLTEASPDPALIEYAITEDDVKGPFVKIPKHMEDQAKLERLGYSSSQELLAEKFHMDEDLLVALNPGRDLEKAGTR